MPSRSSQTAPASLHSCNRAVSDIRGSVEIVNRFGDIRVTNTGPGLTIHSNNGNIEATNVAAGAVIANSFGRVVAADAKSDVECRTRTVRYMRTISQVLPI
jgi:hypothetical protein